MTAYVVFTREKTINAEELQTYREMAPATLAGHAITPLARYGNFEMLEGDPIEGVAIVSFPTVEEARAWYHSPAYQKAAVHRRAGAQYRGFIVEGV